MANTLITFLGRVPKEEIGYRRTVYEFPGGGAGEPTAFFGWQLAQRTRPDQLVILGTAGSMWDHLFEGDFDLGSEQEDARVALVEAVEARAVTEAHLAPLTPLLERRLGIAVRLQLIPYCREPAEQVELLRILAMHVGEGYTLELDVTHAFRHLPMIGLMGALYLRKVRRAKIGHIWYGGYDPDTGKAPVHDLVGLISIADWVEALATFDKDGDYGVFADLLPEDVAPLLREASFFESVHNIGQARGKARAALSKMESLVTADPAFDLFRPALSERLSWAQGDNHYQRQRALALRYLERGSFLYAALFGYEAFITRQANKRGLQPTNPEHRQKARDEYDAQEKNYRPRRPEYEAWDNLRRLRNAVAHGGDSLGREVQHALSSRERMEDFLRELFKRLLPVQE